MTNARRTIFFTVGSLCLLAIGRSAWIYSDLRILEKDAVLKADEPIYFPENWQKKIETVAAVAGVKKLTQLNFAGTDRMPEVNMTWESSLTSARNFIETLQGRNLVGGALRIRMTPSTTSGCVMVKTAFQAPLGKETSGPIVLAANIPLRQVFVANERAHSAAIPSFPRREQKPDRKELERLEQQRRDQEEIARMENKKREMESTYVLTGVVNNGRDTLAVVDARGAQRRMWMVKVGDLVNDVRVASIDESRGEVALDYGGKTQLVLRLNSGGTAQ